MNSSGRWSGVLLGVLLTPVAQAQTSVDSDLILNMRQNVELLSSTLEEGLGLNERRGVFSPRAGDVRGRYLRGQGVVLEVLTPLQTREGFTMDSFSSSLSQLSTQLEGMLQQGAVLRPDFEVMRDQLALSMRSDEVAVYYRELMQQLQSAQDIPAIERGLSAAASSLQSLQSLGQIDPATRNRLAQQLQNQREALQRQMAQWETLRREIREQLERSDALPDASVQQMWMDARARLDVELTALRASVMEQTAEIERQREQAELVRRQQAAEALEEFQSRLFVLLCDYAAGLRSMPAEESLSVVLAGVGETISDGVRRDLIYQVSKDALQSCQQGQITAVQLRERSLRYQY
ncbi:MAG: hypothetical protein Q7W55_12595 [Pseudohongiella sp.]|nr:hypothetical protein [Pseudohongiella sp.]MDO9519985.1 hypothetical protein [Pseudohongiella sp.]MDP2127148.1 hypothetical protein [Pseudohongiella sp.]